MLPKLKDINKMDLKELQEYSEPFMFYAAQCFARLSYLKDNAKKFTILSNDIGTTDYNYNDHEDTNYIYKDVQVTYEVVNDVIMNKSEAKNRKQAYINDYLASRKGYMR